MRPGPGRRLRRLAAALAGWGLVGLILPGSGLQASAASAPAGRLEIGLRFPHASHEALSCIDCHAVEDGRPSGAGHESCASCHVFSLADPDPQDCALCHPQAESGDLAAIRVQLEAPPSLADVRFDHSPVAADAASCQGCHAGVETARGLGPQIFPTMAGTLGRLGEEGKRCSLCHERIRPGLAPPSHAAAGFTSHHGERREAIVSGQCDLCHEIADCHSCHRATAPPNHAGVAWERRHGDWFHDIDRGQCLLCHQAEACRDCHQTRPPTSHTSLWRLRRHGQEAAIDRQSCMLCHREDQCIDCHVETAPEIPPQDFHTRGRDCLLCHGATSVVEPARIHGPLSLDSCLQCHRFGRGARAREAAPRIPQTSFHSADRDCLLCHGPDSGVRPVRRHQAFPVDQCLLCHDFGGAARLGPTVPRMPLRGFHVRLEPCLDCHGPTATIRPLTRHAPYPEDLCLTCHQLEDF